ncbi:hypothetical protein [Variovorax saccharolyticus]|uniref:hypothetical protein n=1 Tax=Variovorax saccharolyticus TaxID=3053516 RepID=UPI00257873A6|nr:hypothetical protein [Variovorax sp. J31P216]MDM0029911.1 hypothetical protein [Variovorax sp. J31P216]
MTADPPPSPGEVKKLVTKLLSDSAALPSFVHGLAWDAQQALVTEFMCQGGLPDFEALRLLHQPARQAAINCAVDLIEKFGKLMPVPPRIDLHRLCAWLLPLKIEQTPACVHALLRFDPSMPKFVNDLTPTEQSRLGEEFLRRGIALDDEHCPLDAEARARREHVACMASLAEYEHGRAGSLKDVASVCKTLLEGDPSLELARRCERVLVRALNLHGGDGVEELGDFAARLRAGKTHFIDAVMNHGGAIVSKAQAEAAFDRKMEPREGDNADDVHRNFVAVNGAFRVAQTFEKQLAAHDPPEPTMQKVNPTVLALPKEGAIVLSPEGLGEWLGDIGASLQEGRQRTFGVGFHIQVQGIEGIEGELSIRRQRKPEALGLPAWGGLEMPLDVFEIRFRSNSTTNADFRPTSVEVPSALLLRSPGSYSLQRLTGISLPFQEISVVPRNGDLAFQCVTLAKKGLWEESIRTAATSGSGKLLRTLMSAQPESQLLPPATRALCFTNAVRNFDAPVLKRLAADMAVGEFREAWAAGGPSQLKANPTAGSTHYRPALESAQQNAGLLRTGAFGSDQPELAFVNQLLRILQKNGADKTQLLSILTLPDGRGNTALQKACKGSASVEDQRALLDFVLGLDLEPTEYEQLVLAGPIGQDRSALDFLVRRGQYWDATRFALLSRSVQAAERLQYQQCMLPAAARQAAHDVVHARLKDARHGEPFDGLTLIACPTKMLEALRLGQSISKERPVISLDKASPAMREGLSQLLATDPLRVEELAHWCGEADLKRWILDHEDLNDEGAPDLHKTAVRAPAAFVKEILQRALPLLTRGELLAALRRRDASGQTPMFSAMQSDNDEFVKQLGNCMAAWAEPEITEVLGACNAQGHSALRQTFRHWDRPGTADGTSPPVSPLRARKAYFDLVKRLNLTEQAQMTLVGGELRHACHQALLGASRSMDALGDYCQLLTDLKLMPGRAAQVVSDDTLTLLNDALAVGNEHAVNAMSVLVQKLKLPPSSRLRLMEARNDQDLTSLISMVQARPRPRLSGARRRTGMARASRGASPRRRARLPGPSAAHRPRVAVGFPERDRLHRCLAQPSARSCCGTPPSGNARDPPWKSPSSRSSPKACSGRSGSQRESGSRRRDRLDGGRPTSLDLNRSSTTYLLMGPVRTSCRGVR